MKIKSSLSSDRRTGGKNSASASQVSPLTPPSFEAIAERAYSLWVSGGCRHGHDHEDWIEAERQLAAQNQPDAASAKF